MIDPCARAEVLADAVMDTLKGERKTADRWDAFDMAACSLLTTAAVYGFNLASQDKIAADLRREFVRRPDSPSAPLLPGRISK